MRKKQFKLEAEARKIFLEHERLRHIALLTSPNRTENYNHSVNLALLYIHISFHFSLDTRPFDGY